MRTLECPDDMQKNVIISSDKGFKNFLRLYGRLLPDQIIGACNAVTAFHLVCVALFLLSLSLLSF